MKTNPESTPFYSKPIIEPEDIQQMTLWRDTVKQKRNLYLIGSEQYEKFDNELRRVKEFLKMYS